MSPTQLFHIPSALKRTRSTAVPAQRHQDRRDTKARDILGVSEADLHSARNHSISSAATSRARGNLSEATTEFGTSIARDEAVTQVQDLQLKASSVLLHDEYYQTSSASSVKSGRLRTYDSNSTLHSHYDSSRAPLSISQQTSDSSRRDFALRKGLSPVNKKSKGLPQLKFKGSKLKGDDGKKLTKERPLTAASHISSTPQPQIQRESHTNRVRFHPSTASPASESPRLKNNLLEPLDPAQVKVNVRRPKVGARHWFDGHEGDSSEEESVHEPAFDETFVTGVESAFQNGHIKPPSDASTITNTIISSSLSSNSTPKSSIFRSVKPEPPPPVPRIAILNAKASSSSMQPSQHSSKRKVDPFKTDLNKTSVLNLSSSDDEDDDEPVTPHRPGSVLSGPQIRDSVAFAFNESQVELGTAETVNAISGPDQSNVRYLKVVSQDKRGQMYMPIPTRKSSRMLSHLTDRSEDDLIASFPATPVESVHSHRTSIRSSVAASEAESLESRRMMSVTKQEESLLAAMRLKKAAMNYHATQDIRLEALRNLERGQSSQRSSTSNNHGFVSAQQLLIDTRPASEIRSKMHKHRRSLSNDDHRYSKASGTTFQTMTSSRNPSRMSIMTFQTDRSVDNITRLSLSSEASNSITPSTADRRSRDTFFSSSSPRIGHMRKSTAQSHIVALDELDKVPERDGIPSQEFIDWPYKGWEARAKLGLAH